MGHHRLPGIRQGGIIAGNEQPLSPGHLLCDGLHLRMLAPPVGIGLQLRRKIATIETGKARNRDAVSSPGYAMTCDAGTFCPRVPAAQRHQFARPAKLRRTAAVVGTASGAQCEQQERTQIRASAKT